MPTTDILKEQVRIEKSRSKKQPFKVTFIGKNREPIATPELFASHKNALKNICAMGRLWQNLEVGQILDQVGKFIIVLDLSQKAAQRYRLFDNGDIQQLDVV